MSIITREQPGVSGVANPHMEVHVFCRHCHPTADQAICGAPMRGRLLPVATPLTCAVCADLEVCPRCLP